MPNREQVVGVARTFVGTRFRHQGRTRQGIDCIGLIVCVAKELSIEVSDRINYNYATDNALLRQELNNQFDKKIWTEMLPGDILMFHCNHNPSHIGIVTQMNGYLGVVHAFLPHRKVVEHILDDKWRSSIAGCYTFKGLE